MKIRTIAVFALSILLVACTTTASKTPQMPSQTPKVGATQAPSKTFAPTAKPTQISAPTSTATSTTTPEANLALKRVAQLGGSINGITIVGDVAYIGMGPRVAAIDISDHQDPQLTVQSEPLPGLVTQLVQVSQGGDPLLLANAGKYLILLDTSTPGKIKPIHQLELQGEVTAMVWDTSVRILYAGGTIYQSPMSLGYTGFVSAVDISLERRLRLSNSVRIPARVLSLALGNGSLFAGGEGQETGLYHIQLKTPLELDTPRLVIASTPEEPLHPIHMQVIGERLYLGYRAIEAYDITDPDQPVRAWSVNVDIVVDSFKVVGKQITAFGWTILTEYKLDIVTIPEPIEGTPLGVISADVAMHNGNLLVAYNDLEIYDISNPQGPWLEGSYQAAVIHAIDAAANESTVFVVDNGLGASNSGATVRGFSLPDLVPLGQVETELPGWYSYVGLALEGDWMYVAGKNGIWVYDVGSSQPKLLGNVEIGKGEIFAIAALNIGGQRLLVAAQATEDHSGMLSIYALTDWEQPTKLGEPLSLDQGNISQIIWNGSALYVLLDSSYFANIDMLYTIDYDNNALALRGSLELAGYIEHMGVEGNTVMLTGIDEQMDQPFVTVVEAEPLRIVAKVTLPEHGMGLAMVKDKALVVVGGQYCTAHLLTFDLQDPANPRQVNAMDMAASAGTRGITIIPSVYLILANGAGGLELLDYNISVTGSLGKHLLPCEAGGTRCSSPVGNLTILGDLDVHN
jgi:hypothetical protein